MSSASDPQASPPVARVWWWYAAAVVLLVSAYFALPVARPGLAGAVGLGAVGAIEYGIRRLRPQRAGAWRCLGLAVGLLAIGDVIFVALDARSPAVVPYPDIPDAFYVAAYLPLTIALFWLGRPIARHGDETSIIDVISVTLAGSLVVWILAVRPELQEQGLSTAGRIAAVAGWVGYIAVLSASVRVVLYWRRNVSAVMISVAIVSFLVSEIFYGLELVRGTWTAGGPVDLGYFAFSALCGAAALHPSMRDIASLAHARHALGPWRLTMIAVGLLAGPTALLVEVTLGVVDTGFAIAIVSGLVSVLLLVRLVMTGRAYQRRAARERAGRVASQALVAAITPLDVVAGIRHALRAVLRDHGKIDVVLVDRYAPDAPRNRVEPVGPGDRGELAFPLPGSDAALVFAAPVYELAELADLLSALADQAALALQRIQLARAAGAEDRERYFRTLVLTSTDVILISRDGRIEYATPSAHGMFDRDVVGERFDDIVQPVRPAQLRPAAHEAAPEGPLWPNQTGDTEATVTRRDKELTVLVHRRDLTDEPTVRGVVTTLRDITAERALQRDLAYRASHDELTGLANVRAWGESLTAEGDRRRGPGDGVAIIFIDLDNFKNINDRHGHPVGDELLAEVAQRIQSSLRAGDLAARIGGDEFAVLLRGLSNADEARGVARRIADALARPADLDWVEVECQASIGLSYTEGRERVHALVRQADTALYAAKAQGKGRWTEYNPTQWAPSRKTHDGSPRREPSAAAGGARGLGRRRGVA